ncbi:MAG: YicC family protein [Candidatus Omnitrophota bacterium]|nr:MAG: YicC family protein [Candidatus Omnitrophota bacterium]
MIRSMTGFGKGEVRGRFGFFGAEIKTINHKFLEITFKLPNSLAIFDDKVKALIKNRIKRGKVYLNLVHETAEGNTGNIFIDENLARNYSSRLKRLKKKLNIKDPVKIADIVSFPGVINYKLANKGTAKMWPFVKEAIEESLKKLVKDREKEGSFLFKDLIWRINKVKRIVSNIKGKAASNVQNYKKKLGDRIKELSGGYPIDNGRLEIEVALFAKNSDITEELTRLNNHIDNFTKTIRKDSEVGKKLDFIAQELHREINTIGAKSSGFNISSGVIEIKTEIEKIREQLKNIE